MAKAVIWDMDGVIADTAPFHFQAWQETFREEGVDFTAGDFRHSFGLRNDDIIMKVLGKDTPDYKIEAVARRKETNFRRRIGGKVELLPGVAQLLSLLKEEGFKQAVASSAPVENLQLLIEVLEIDGFFDCIVSEKDVTQGKPDPEVFLIAAQRLGVIPRDCVVIEDAVAGVKAAKAAGMKCIAVTTTHPADHLNEADLVVDSLEEVGIKDVANFSSY